MFTSLKKKHRKNCECCPVSFLIVRWQKLSWIQVLTCQNCDRCVKSHKSLGLSKLSEIVRNCQSCQKLSKLSKIVKVVRNCQSRQKLSKLSEILKVVRNCQGCQKLSMLSEIRIRISKHKFVCTRFSSLPFHLLRISFGENVYRLISFRESIITLKGNYHSVHFVESTQKIGLVQTPFLL